VGGVAQTPQGGSATGLSAFGTALPGPALSGSQFNATFNNLSNTPRRRLGDLVKPVETTGRLHLLAQAVAVQGLVPLSRGGPAAPAAAVALGVASLPPSARDAGQRTFLRPGASTIYREQGERMIAVKFSVRGRDLGSAVAEATQKMAEMFKPPYRVEWSGEFEEMQSAEARLMIIIPLSVGLVIILLYLAFGSILDVLVVLSNVVALSLGGIWALLLTNTHFSISAAVGFISIFGVAIMDGLLSVAYFNAQRAHGVPLRPAILEGAGKRVRPMMMTALTAIFGLLPAALSTRIGAQTQRPLAIVVVGGMIMTLLLNRYLMPVLYSFYGHREPPADAGGLAH
jgi:cobalt-zinc-cadmium resistance protein CzcA